MTKNELKAAQNKLELLKNSKAAIEQMTDNDCFELFGISKARAMKNTSAAISRIEYEIERAENPQTSIDKTLTGIAAKYFIAVEERGDLETHHSDCDDYFEVSVWGLKAALKDAYDAGRMSK